jgi:hypothetical protein
MARHSGLQKQVLSMYAAFLRVIRTKQPEGQPGLRQVVGTEFRRGAQVPKSDFRLIEHLIRKGGRQLELLKSDNIQSISVERFSQGSQ